MYQYMWRSEGKWKTMTAKNSARNSALSLKTSAKYDSPSKQYINYRLNSSAIPKWYVNHRLSNSTVYLIALFIK